MYFAKPPIKICLYVISVHLKKTTLVKTLCRYLKVLKFCPRYLQHVQTTTSYFVLLNYKPLLGTQHFPHSFLTAVATLLEGHDPQNREYHYGRNILDFQERHVGGGAETNS